VLNLIHKIVLLLISKKGLKESKGSSYLSESSKEFDLAKTIVKINEKEMLISYK
jgi:hypothetical protein